MSPKLMIIGGMSRSGTTMLKNVCNSHSGIWLTNEFRSFEALDTFYPRYITRLRRHRWNRLFFPSQGEKTPRQRYLSNIRFLGEFSLRLLPYAHKPINAETLRRVLHQMQPEKMIVGDKYPSYIWQLERYTQIPNMFPVIIYRDCRDVVQSTLKMVETKWAAMSFARNLDTPEKIAARWVQAVEQMQRYADHIFTIRYETLVEHPQPIIEQLGAWLGVHPNGFDTSIIRDSSVGKYRMELSSRQITQVEAIAGHVMEQLGYV
jgi:hypothetical protein